MTAPTAAPESTAEVTYWPALDGLRAIAVSAVVLYHAGATSDLAGIAPGGFIGVSVFFTLSGYLVTGLLLRGLAAPGSFDVATFWSRRLKRLAPASLVVVLASVVLAPWWWDGMATSDAVAGIFGYTNWHVIWSGEDALLRTIVGPLGPFWSLAVEEQFYLLMTAAVIVAARTARPLRALAVFVAVGWTGSAAIQLFADWPQYRLEFGTDVRAAELLAGSALALVLHRRPDLRAAIGRRMQPIGAVALGVVLVIAATTDYDPPWLLHGGYAALSILNATLVLSLMTPGAFTTMMSWRPFVTVGRLSYSWYLVHWPVILALSPERTGLDSWPLLVSKVAVSFLVAVALHRAVEQPLRRMEPPRRVVVVTWLGASLLVAAVAVVALL